MASNDDKVLIELCSAAGENDATQIAKLLGHRKRSSRPPYSSLHTPLLPSGPLAQDVLRQLADRCCLTSNDIAPFELVGKALLLSPSIYETPWVAACELVKYLQQQAVLPNDDSTASDRRSSCVLDIQTFLQQTVALWWEEERKLTALSTPTTVQQLHSPQGGGKPSSAAWMTQLVELVMTPLLHNISNITATNWTNTPLELIATTVALAKDLDESLFQTVLDQVVCCCPSRIRPDAVLPWVHLCAELRLYLRPSDWNSVQQTLQNNARIMTQEGLTSLAQGILSLSGEVLRKSLASEAEMESLSLGLWQDLLMHVLWEAKDASLFSTIETLLLSHLSALPSVALQLWTLALTTKNHPKETVPPWIQACMLLQVLRAAKGSQLVSHLVARAVRSGTTTESIDVTLHCWHQLVELTGIIRKGKKQRYKQETVDDLKQAFVGLSYQGQGRFQGGDDEETFSQAGALVFQSLFRGKTDSAETALALERAQAWIRSASKVLDSSRHEPLELAMVAAVFVTVYCEIPMSRSFLVRGMIEAYLEEVDLGNTAARVYCGVISIVLQNSRHADSLVQSTEMEQVAQVFAKPLQLPLFMELVDALLTLPRARRSLLAAAQKYCCELSITSREAGSKTNRLQCGLYALAALLCSETWGEVEREAWKLLSTFLVSCTPPLSVTLRSWLFDQLRVMLKKGSFSTQSAQHLLRGCLSRLLVFFGPDKDGLQSFRPETAFVSWETTGSSETEDLPGLLGLIMDLVHFGSHGCDDDKSKESLVSWQQRLFTILDGSGRRRDAQNGCSQSHPSVIEFCDDAQLPYHVALYGLSLVLQRVLKSSSSAAGRYASQPVSFEELKGLLAKQEVRDLNCCELPAWLGPSTHVIGYSPEHFSVDDPKKVALLCSAVADIVLEFLVGPRWPWSWRSNMLRPGNRMPERAGVILSAQRSLREGSAFPGFTSVFHRQAVLATYEEILSGVVPSVAQAIQDEATLEEMDVQLSMILDICDFVREASGIFVDCLSCWRFMKLLHEIYKCLCNESSCVRLISCLDRKLSGDAEQSSTEDRQHLSGLTSLRTEDDVDVFVRLIRNSVSKAISSVASATMKLSKEKPDELAVVSARETWSFASGSELPGLLRSLCQDMHDGVKGESGGLTFDLFMAFLVCVENITWLLKDCITTLPSLVEKNSELLLDVTRSSRFLEEIFAFPIFNQASVFKKLLMVSSSVLPSLTRAVLRSNLSMKDASLKSFDGSNGHVFFATRCFIQCADVLYRVAKGDDILWEGDFDDDDDVASCSSKQGDKGSESANANQVVLAARGTSTANGSSSRRGAAVKSGSHPLIFLHERSWTWASCTALHALDDYLVESYLLIQDAGPCVSADVFVKRYFRWRVDEFRECLSALCLPFKDVETSSSEATRGSAKPRRLCAMSLPGTGKARFCAVLERFFLVLIRSTKMICKLLQSASRIVPEEDMALSQLEALCCLSSWLTTGTSKVDDITCGLRSWHQCEKSSYEVSVGRGVHAAEDAVLRKLPRVESRVDELETSLRTLSQTLKDARFSTKQKSKGVLDDINAIVKSHPATKDFAHMVSGKLKMVAEGQLSLDSEAGVGPNAGRKRKVTAHMQKRLKRERRRPTVRSRNDVVDKWLQMDKEMCDGEAYGEDAFADLEDFIVDG
jgi:hypothetical protein